MSCQHKFVGLTLFLGHLRTAAAICLAMISSGLARSIRLAKRKADLQQTEKPPGTMAKGNRTMNIGGRAVLLLLLCLSACFSHACPAESTTRDAVEKGLCGDWAAHACCIEPSATVDEWGIGAESIHIPPANRVNGQTSQGSRPSKTFSPFTGRLTGSLSAFLLQHHSFYYCPRKGAAVFASRACDYYVFALRRLLC